MDIFPVFLIQLKAVGTRSGAEKGDCGETETFGGGGIF